ncbi:hypothetical protein [Engelhardtia mirabilis]|uniref:Uncharacterized protein n=1 Tax=Engelhardtia mirabilis TaxID=2528011 RepID=A0A518BIK1_9BACT|nr:hypothetical protein Pla133_18710 [Planctomycetes bacterium Pla133]QDV01121.1 hypothetical protein Pla86_18700 [Planctomycetes bacterium Pla86]
MIHFRRGPTYALLFLALPSFGRRGAWFTALLGILAFDRATSIADIWFVLERRHW